MAKTPMIYFSSDWHFGHSTQYINKDGEQKFRGIIDFERHQFKTIQEHDDYLIELLTSWSEKWVAGSTLWFLGDFGNTDYLWVFDMFAKKGIETHFILGNHDKAEDISKIVMYCDYVHEYPVFISQKLVLSHYPVAVYEDSINVCGHLHGSKLKDDNHIIASIHVANYKPISEKQINATFSKLPKFNRRFLYEPYAADYVFTQPKADVLMDKNGRIDLSASRLLMKLRQEQHPIQGYNPYTGGI